MTTPSFGPTPSGQRTLVAVLVGGEARRLGGIWKPGLWWNGQSVLQRRLIGAEQASAAIVLAGTLPSSSDRLTQQCVDRLVGAAAVGVNIVADGSFARDGRPAGPGSVVRTLSRHAAGQCTRLGLMAGDVCSPLTAELAALSRALDADPTVRGAVLAAADDTPVWDRSLWHLPLDRDAGERPDGGSDSPPLWRVLGATSWRDCDGVALLPTHRDGGPSETGDLDTPGDLDPPGVLDRPGDLDTPGDVAHAIGADSLRLGVLQLDGADPQPQLDRLRQIWVGHSVIALAPQQVRDHLDGVRLSPVDVIGILPRGPRSSEIA